MDNVYELPCSKKVVCVFLHGKYAFVGLLQHGLKCLSCRYDANNCNHVIFVQHAIDEDDESYPFLCDMFANVRQQRQPSVPSCLSKNKIKFADEDHSLQFVQNVKSVFPVDENVTLQLGGSSNECSCCHKCSNPWNEIMS